MASPHDLRTKPRAQGSSRTGRGRPHRPALRRPARSGSDGKGWIATARGTGPIVVVLPLAAFCAVWLADGPPVAEAQPSPNVHAWSAQLPDTVTTRFAVCGGGARGNCVVDGDTIWLHGEKIRIADINTPETGDPGCPYEAELGARATARLTALLNQGAFAVAPDPDGRDEDRYGRKLRVLTRGGESLSQALVAEGLAEEWRGYRRDWC